MVYRIRFPSLILGYLLVATASVATADIAAFNNFDADGGYANSGIWFGRGGEFELWFAQRFEPIVAGEVRSIETAMRLQRNSGGINEVTLRICPDIGGEPGTEELWRKTYFDALSTSFSSTSTFQVTDGPRLEQGLKYWLVADGPPEGTTPYIWQAALVGSEASASYYVDGEELFPLYTWLVNTPHPDDASGFAMRLLVVPEPSTVVLLGSVGTLLLTAGYRPKLEQVSDNSSVGWHAFTAQPGKHACANMLTPLSRRARHPESTPHLAEDATRFTRSGL